MANVKGFRVCVHDGKNMITITNAQNHGFVSFNIDASVKTIDLPEKRFIDLVKYLKIEADKIEAELPGTKSIGDFKVEEEKDDKRGKDTPTTSGGKQPAKRKPSKA
ncbi:MAG: hypothetical protein IJ225_10395 [Solobacterium sp.]|nr:hypothetical protein [Solobacterium sp.]